MTECQAGSEPGCACAPGPCLCSTMLLPCLQASADTCPVETSCARSPGAQIVRLSAAEATAEVIAEPAVPALLVWDMSVGGLSHIGIAQECGRGVAPGQRAARASSHRHPVKAVTEKHPEAHRAWNLLEQPLGPFSKFHSFLNPLQDCYLLPTFFFNQFTFNTKFLKIYLY